MSNRWTPERRQQQSVLIQRWKPWRSSTGPRTESGKEKSARNAEKGGGWKKYREAVKALHYLLREQKDLISSSKENLFKNYAHDPSSEEF